MIGSRFRILKFGGSTLGAPERLRQAAQMVGAVQSTVRAVVASAPGATTDRLWELTHPEGSSRDSPEAVRAVGLGDAVGAALLAAELVAQGLPARLLLPGSEEWPVLTKGEGWEAEVDRDRTAARLRELQDRLDPFIWVIPGYVGVDPRSGHWAALGRGGSDVTAVALGRCLPGSEVTLVKEVPGVLSGDPERMPRTTVLPELTVREMAWLAEGGAGVVAPRALGYLGSGMTLRVVGLGADLEQPGGTRIVLDPGAESDPALDRARVRRAVEVARRAGWSSVVTLPDPAGPVRPSGDAPALGSDEAAGRRPLAFVVPPEDLDRLIDHLQSSGRIRALAVRAPGSPPPASGVHGGPP